MAQAKMARDIETLEKEHNAINQKFKIVTGEEMIGKPVMELVELFYAKTGSADETKNFVLAMSTVLFATRNFEKKEIEEAKRQAKAEGNKSEHKQLQMAEFLYGIRTDQLREEFKTLKQIVDTYQ